MSEPYDPWDHVEPTSDAQRARQEARNADPVWFELPGQPPVERRVRATDGTTYQRVATGMWKREDGKPDLGWFSWAYILERHNRVQLVPLTDAELDDAKLYGPPGQRWGDPNEPCPYQPCALRLQHAGPHIDDEGNPLAQTEATEDDPTFGRVTRADLAVVCTCGQPGRHLPTCPRYARLTGGE